jgi:hypothetical protein
MTSQPENTYSTKRKILISVAGVLAVAITGAAVWFGLGTLKPNPVKEITTSTVGEVISSIVPKKTHVSTLLTPASAEWLRVIDGFNPSFNLDDLTWDSLPVSPTSLGLSISYSTEVNATVAFGLNAVYMTTDSVKEAETLKNYMAVQKPDIYQAFTVDKTVVLIPLWVVSDVEFNLEDYTPSTQTSGTVDKAYWSVDFQGMSDLINLSNTEEDRALYLKAFSALGFNTKTLGSWSGVSEDGLTWVGTFSDEAWAVENVSPEEYYTVLQSTEVFIPNDPTADPEGEQFGTIEPNQSLMLDYLSIQTNEYAEGRLRQSDGQFNTPEKLTEENVTKIVVNPNAWAQIMAKGDGIRPYFKYDVMEITVNSHLNTTTIKLSEAEWFNEI